MFDSDVSCGSYSKDALRPAGGNRARRETLSCFGLEREKVIAQNDDYNIGRTRQPWAVGESKV